MKKIYLAGPEVFFPEPLALAAQRKEYLLTLELAGHFPLDNQIVAGTPEETARAIFRANCDLLDECDAVLANMTPFRGPSMDVGTAWEIGYAFAQGKPIAAYSEDLSAYHEKVHASGWSHEPDATVDKYGHEIENFGGIDNLMMTQSIIDVSESFETAALALKDFLQKKST